MMPAKALRLRAPRKLTIECVASSLGCAGTPARAYLQIAQVPGHQRLVADGAAAHHAVDVVADQVDIAVADTQVELDFRVALVKGWQRRDEDHAGQRAGHVHPQPAPGHGRGGGQAGFGVVHIGQQAGHPLVVGGAVGGDVDLARGAVEQAHAQSCLQLLHQLGHAGLAHVQGVGSLGEAAGFHHAGECLHRIETVHRDSRLIGIVWILQTVLDNVARLSVPAVFLE
jgi:hypothetical protein